MAGMGTKDNSRVEKIFKDLEDRKRNKIEIVGTIKGKQRPRFTGVGSNGKPKVYTKQDTVMYENWVRWNYQEQKGKYHDGPVSVEIVAYFKIPKSYKGSKLQKALTNELKVVKKPDTDNIAKVILDSLNGIAFKDDSYVTDLRVRKLYTDDLEKVELIITDI